MSMDGDDRTTLKAVLFTVFCVLLLIMGGCWGYPHYAAYSQRLQGEAELAHAEYSKRVAVETAKAKKDSAALEGEAEVARAHGVAEANQIIGDSLKNNEAYLRWLWIKGLEANDHTQLIYIPTEAGLPILEAGRRP